MNSLEQKLDDLFVNKAPGMSAEAKETTAKVLPWVMIVFGVLGLMAWLSSLRFFFGYAGLMRHAYGNSYPDIFMMVYYMIAPIVQAASIYGGYLMLSGQRKGWRLALYALLLGVITHLFSFSVLGIVLDVLFTYLLFQIKEQYVQ